MIYKWTYEEPTADETAAATALAREVNIHPALGRLLLKRGIKTATEARRFFRPQLSDLHDPFLMNDMQVAVDRLNQALGRKEHIMVYGDYDVDGCTAVALVYKFLSQFYSNIDFYIPDRYEEGYGISRKGIDFAAEMGVKLIIVLDCGIKAVEEVAYAREKGIDFIIATTTFPTTNCRRPWRFLIRNAMTTAIPIPTSRAAAWDLNSCRHSPPATALSSTSSRAYSTSAP